MMQDELEKTIKRAFSCRANRSGGEATAFLQEVADWRSVQATGATDQQVAYALETLTKTGFLVNEEAVYRYKAPATTAKTPPQPAPQPTEEQTLYSLLNQSEQEWEQARQRIEQAILEKANVKPANDTQVGGDHYRTMAVQPWDALRDWLGDEAWYGYMVGSAIAYLARAHKKNGEEDIAKAEHFLRKLREVFPTLSR